MCDERTALAYHESGHAVVGHYLERELTEVRIEPDACTEFATADMSEEHAVALYMAGYRSVEIFHGAETAAEYDASLRRASIDYRGASNTFSTSDPRSLNPDRIEKNARAIVDRILDECRAEVVALATELLDRGRVSGAEAVQIIDDAQ